MDNISQEEISSENETPEQSWSLLSIDAQHAAVDITLLSSERIGPSSLTVGILQIQPRGIEELIENGWLNLKPRGEIAEEYVNSHKEEIEEIKKIGNKSQCNIDKLTDFQREYSRMNDKTIIYQIPSPRIKFIRELVNQTQEDIQ